jgi:ribosomal protein S17E
MLNLDVTPAEMSSDEIKSWLNECAAEIEKAYDEDNITYANKLDMIYQAVKQMGAEKLKNESFKGYMKASFLSESVTEDGSETTSLIEVDECINSIKKELKNCEVELDAKVTVDANLKVVDFQPITVDIGFKLPYIDDLQHIVLTYTPSEIPTDLDIDSIPAKDYKAIPQGENTEIAFKSITNLSDNLPELMFKETIEWPFEMDFKSAAVEKKFNKNKTLSGKIVALLGKEQLINKVSGYQSTHSSGSNRATRAKREAEVIRASVRARGPFKSRTEILKDTLTAIPGITSVREMDVMGDHKYYKKFRITFNGGWFDVFNGGMDFRVTDSTGGFGNSQEFRTDTHDPDASVNNTRNKVVAYIKQRMEAIKRGGMSARERAALEMRNRPQRRDLTTEYNEFVKMAEETLAGTNVTSRDVLSDKYDRLMYSERFLSDEQMAKITELATQLDI